MKTIAKVFQNGGSQAIRVPKAFRFPGKTVVFQHIKGGVLVASVRESEKSQHEAARIYQDFLRTHPEEQAAMDAWESAPLAD